MKFEGDESKNKDNILKHGFDFADAPAIFDLRMLTGVDSRGTYVENRFVGIGFLKERVVVVVFVEGADNTIRLIALRKP